MGQEWEWRSISALSILSDLLSLAPLHIGINYSKGGLEMKKGLLVGLVLLIINLLLVSCGPPPGAVRGEQPRPESDSPQEYVRNARVPVDDNVYTIRGVVAGDVESLVRQIERARGSVGGWGFGGIGVLSGSYFGPELGGKGFIRLQVEGSNSHLAPVGEVVILKCTDTKAILLKPGDRVTFKCRHQYEAVAPVRKDESFDSQKAETWEIDYCRLISPIIETSQMGE